MAVKTNVKLSTISYVILYVKDTEKSLAFYRDTLGTKVKSSEDGWVELDTGATTLALHKDDGKYANTTTPGKAVVVFGVDNIKQTYEALKGAGVKFGHEPHQVCETPDHIGMSADFEDPDGNLLSIFGMEKK